MKERIIGVVMLGFGVLLGYLCVYKPLEDARSGAESVSVSLKGAILAPVTLIGLPMLILGPRVNALVGTREQPKPAVYLISFVLLAAGVGLYIWLRSVIAAQGYQFNGLF